MIRVSPDKPDGWAIVSAAGQVLATYTMPPPVQDVEFLTTQVGDLTIEPMYLGKILGATEFEIRHSPDMEVSHIQQYWNFTTSITIKLRRDSEEAVTKRRKFLREAAREKSA